MRFKTNKYKNKKVIYDGIEFDSKKEANRYKELKLLEKYNKIKDLKLQEKILLQEGFRYKGKAIIKIEYICDFKYYDNEKEKTIIEDVKSDITRKDKTYVIKKKLLLHEIKDNEDIEFVEVN